MPLCPNWFLFLKVHFVNLFFKYYVNKVLLIYANY